MVCRDTNISICVLLCEVRWGTFRHFWVVDGCQFLDSRLSSRRCHCGPCHHWPARGVQIRMMASLQGLPNEDISDGNLRRISNFPHTGGRRAVFQIPLRTNSNMWATRESFYVGRQLTLAFVLSRRPVWGQDALPVAMAQVAQGKQLCLGVIMMRREPGVFAFATLPVFEART